MRYKYVATLFTYGNDVVSEEILDNSVDRTFTTEFYGRLCIARTFKHKVGDVAHFMVEWETKQKISDNKHYIDAEIDCVIDELTGKVIEMSGMRVIRLSPTHANTDAIKVISYNNFFK